MTSPSTSQLRSHISTLRRKRMAAGGEEPSVIGIHVTEPWRGPAAIECDGVSYDVKFVRSGLEAREAILKTESGACLLLLTTLPDREIGIDVLSHLSKTRLEVLSPVEAVKEHFQAKEIDPRIREYRWMFNDLLACPSEPVPMGFLDLESAWNRFLRHRFGLDVARPDGADLLKWAQSTSRVEAWQKTSPPVRICVSDWIGQSAGETGRALLKCLESHSGPDALAIGLILDALLKAPDSKEIEKREALVRMERLAGDQPLNLSSREWAKSARAAIADLDGSERRAILAHTESLMEKLHIGAFARFSDLLPMGLTQMLEDAAGHLKSLLDFNSNGSLAALNEQFASIKQHEAIKADVDRATRFTMALRLAKWVLQPNPAFKRLEDAAIWFALEGQWVDLARKWTLHCDSHQAWAQAVSSLRLVAGRKRENINKEFANLLLPRLTQQTPGHPLILLEDVLPRFIRPICEQQSVLLLLMDGMDRSSFLDLKSSIENRWEEIDLPVGPTPVPLTPLPSITETCRTSLLSGELRHGTSMDERQSFDFLRIKGKRPIIFHKDQIIDAGIPSLELRQAMGSQSRLVAVVVNAVDDWLSKGDQAFISWRAMAIPIVQTLLELAVLHNRLVVFASDHGHVIEDQTVYRSGSGSERYRQPTLDTMEGEYAIKGVRVIGGACIAAWSERLRYIHTKKTGYHGGMTPQETIPVLAVVRPVGDARFAGTVRPPVCPSFW